MRFLLFKSLTYFCFFISDVQRDNSEFETSSVVNRDEICTENNENVEVQNKMIEDQVQEPEVARVEASDYDSDDSIADPIYEPVRHHVVADLLTESEEDINETNSNKGRPRKGRKRKIAEQSREEGKKKKK